MIHRTFFVYLISAFALSACSGESPTGSDSTLDQAVVALTAEAALETNDVQGTPLPSLENLLRRTHKAIRDQGGHPRGQRLIKIGKPLDAIVAVLGPGVVAEAVAGVDQALVRLDTRFAGRILPDWAQRTLDRAKALAEKSHEGLAAERYVATLSVSLNAAELIRSLSPRYQARMAIQRGTQIYLAAVETVAGSPTEDEAAALKKARRKLAAAKEAFENKEFRKSVRLATEGAILARNVLKGRNGA